MFGRYLVFITEHAFYDLGFMKSEKTSEKKLKSSKHAGVKMCWDVMALMALYPPQKSR
jgi:hypothetical protein